MIRYWITILALSVVTLAAQAQYRIDILGDRYQCRTICMSNDYDGRVVCTLIKKPQTAGIHKAVLYIHGYDDYFFQKELGDSIVAHGYNFYALDLRKYGRSILPHQDPFFCKSLNEYFADIDTALAVMQSEGNSRILLMAHSTGGLITPLYLRSKSKHASCVKALILNSPFLEWNFGWFMKKIVMPVVSFIGKFFPNLVVDNSRDAIYSHSLLKKAHGEWEYDTTKKMEFGHPKKAGWIHAIETGQREVQTIVWLKCPVLVMSSDKSIRDYKGWSEELRHADIVLNRDDIQKFGARLGSNVTRKNIHGGMHDLFLSPHPARDIAYQTTFNWMRSLEFVPKR